MIYLDSAATTAVRREVVEAMWPFLTHDFGNPSSRHSVGESAARALQQARQSIAGWLGCRASDIVFTSGGTEADNLAIKGLALGAARGRHLVTTRIEHEAVLASCDYLRRQHGFEVDFAETDAAGRVTADALTAVLRPDTTLVSVAHANNEVGTVQPISELSALAHRVGALFHTDAVQSAGWLDIRRDGLGVDALSVSGHKLGAPKGVGVLMVRGSLALEPLLHGGGQERGSRSGTENVAFAVGMARAVALVDTGLAERAVSVAALRDRFVAAVLCAVPDAQLTGDPVRRLPGVASFVFPGTSGESVLLRLEERGIVSSSGSACAAGNDGPSHVLVALGFPAAVAQTAVRFSFGAEVDHSTLEGVPAAIKEAIASVRSIGRSSATGG